MDSYNSYICSSSSSTHNFSSYQQTERKPKPSPSYHSALHSIRKPLQPKPMMKKPIAPLPPTPPKIYQVDSTNFKQVVQRLTSVPEFQPRRLQDVAPPPLNLSTPTTFSDHEIQTLPFQLTPSNKSPFSATFRYLMNETVLDTKPAKLSDNLGTLMSPLGFSLSPASLAWCSFLLESPGTLSTLEPGTVL